MGQEKSTGKEYRILVNVLKMKMICTTTRPDDTLKDKNFIIFMIIIAAIQTKVIIGHMNELIS